MIKSVEEVLIFESPDGGKTVYARKPGETDRTLVRTDPQYAAEQEFYQKWLLYRDILNASKDNVALQDLLDKTEMMYKLIKSEQC